MKALTDRLELLRVLLVDGMPDEDLRRDVLDVWIEINAIAEALPEITMSVPLAPPPKTRVVPQRVIRLPGEGQVHSGGSHRE